MSFLLPIASQDFDGIRPFDARFELMQRLKAGETAEGWEALMDAQRKLGYLLSGGELKAYVQLNERWYLLAAEAWRENGVLGERSLICSQYMTYSNSQSAREIEGRTWCFEKSDWNKVRTEILGENLPKRGRPKGAGAYNDDAALLKMTELIASGFTKRRAAMEALPRDIGKIEPESAAKRLERKYDQQMRNK